MNLVWRPCLGVAVLLCLWPVLGGVTCDNRCEIPVDESFPALCVLVLDKDTGEVITNATVQATDGWRTETLLRGVQDPFPAYGIWRGGDVLNQGYCGVSRTGTYTVTVQAEGYQMEQVADVRMLENCLRLVPVLPVDLLVELSRDVVE